MYTVFYSATACVGGVWWRLIMVWGLNCTWWRSLASSHHYVHPVCYCCWHSQNVMPGEMCTFLACKCTYFSGIKGGAVSKPTVREPSQASSVNCLSQKSFGIVIWKNGGLLSTQPPIVTASPRIYFIIFIL